ncbi:MAG: tRNA (adenosine(37)-N6)-threonylcarbamoyltransferase complex ATPase subunit type 1 TsaE [Silvanigrellales bacterium]|nr:tRNA (adenosine(37)-N6)-threonylcarbamoyltransferase complex ATPase subunit type 1 TsaE [Silvanigrellales bacterium]
MSAGGSLLFEATLPESSLQQVVSLLVPLLGPGVWLFLEGDLGAGKTTLTRALLSALGSMEHGRSPTFSLLDVVPLSKPVPTSRGELVRILHLDLYRLKNGRELTFLGLEGEFRKGTAAIFEWASQVAEDEWEDFFQATGCRRPERILTLEINRVQTSTNGLCSQRHYVLAETPALRHFFRT